MIRMVVKAIDGSVTSLTVKQILSVDGVPYDAPPPAPSLTELTNRVTILEALVQPLAAVLVESTTPPEPPLPPEQER